MKTILYPGMADTAVSHWVGMQLENKLVSWGPHKSFGVIENGEFIAGVVMTHYNGNDMVMHVASTSRRWLSKKLLYEIFHYAFDICGCKRVTSLVDSSNTHVLEFDKGLGFIREGVARKGGKNDDDKIILGMLREECRFLEYGEQHEENISLAA